MDIAHIARAIGLEEAEYRELLDLFMQVTPADLRSLESALGAGDVEGAQRAAHSIKGASSNLGLTEIGETAARIETMVLAGRLAETADLFSELGARLERLARFVAIEKIDRLLGASSGARP